MESKTLDECWDEIRKSSEKWNREVNKRNRRRFRCIEKIQGKTFVRYLRLFLKESEAIDYMGFNHEYVFVRDVPKNARRYEAEGYSKKITTCYAQSWAEGDGGDSWSGFIYIGIKHNRFLECPFNS